MAEGEIDRLWRAFQHAPASPTFHELVRALLTAGRHGDAVRVCEIALPHHASDARAYLAFGKALRGVGRWADAQAALVRAMKLDPSDPACARALGEILFDQGEARRARELFAHALRHAPGDITLRELLERASGAAGLPAIPDPVHAAARVTPPPRPRATRKDSTREDTFEIVEVDVVDGATVDQSQTDVGPIPAALEVALRAELTLSNLPVPGRATPSPHSSVPRRTPLPPASGSMPAPPRAPAPARPPEPPLLSVEAGTARRETTDEISARDLIEAEDAGSFPPVAIIPAARAPVATVVATPRGSPAPRPRGRRTGRIVAVIIAAVVLLGGAGAAAALWWTKAQRAERARRDGAQAERALAQGDAEGYRTALRLSERALRAAPGDPAARDRAAVARGLALLEAGVGTAAAAEAKLRGLGETLDADAARAAVRIAAGDWASAEGIVRRDPGPRAGPVLPYLRGLLAAFRGDPEARALLVTVTKRFGRHVPTRLALAELDLVEGAPDRALGQAERARQAQPASLRPVVMSLLAQAPTGDPTALLGLAGDLAARLPKGSACDKLMFATARATALARAGRLTEARSAATTGEAVRCADPLAIVLWARAASAAGARSIALPAIARVRQRAPAALVYRVTEASILVDSGRAVEAERLIADAAGSSIEVDVLLARAATAREDDVAAIPMLRRVLERQADRDDVRLLLLRARVRAGDAEAAEEVRALERARPDDPAILLASAELALVARDAPGAVERLERVVAREPSAEAYQRLGMALRLAARFGDAVDAFRKAFDRSPDDAASLEAAASLELARGRLDDAEAIATQLAGAPAGQSASELLRVEIAIARGDAAAATARLDRLPRTPAPVRRVELLRARALARSGEIERALLVLDPLVAEGRDAEALALRGEIRRGRPADRVGAAEDFERALALDGALPEALIGRLEIALDRNERTMVASLVERTVAALQARLRPPALHARLLVARARDALAVGQRGRGEAEALLGMATETAPQHAEAWYWLGKVVGPDDPRGRAALQRSLDLLGAGALADDARRLLR